MYRLSIFDIPHIQSAITANLTYADLRHCVLVSKIWFRGFNPVLWKEFHSYDSSMNCCKAARYPSLFATLDTRRSLLKHCNHIRSLSVRGSNLLRVLLGSACVHLHEIHYAVDWSHMGELGLQDLLALMDQNPNLCALKLTQLELVTQEDERDFREFVKCLKEYPEVQRVQIEFVEWAKDVELVLAYETLAELMRFKKTVNVRMKLQRWPSLELSRRRAIVSDPVRRALDEQRVQNAKDRQAKELQEIATFVKDMGPFLVQDLYLNVDFNSQDSELARLLLQRCRHLNRLYAWHLVHLEKSPIHVLLNKCFHIQHLDLCLSNGVEDWAEIFRVSQGLVSVQVSGMGLTRLSQEALEKYHGATLQSFSVTSYTNELNLPSLLAKCPKLLTFVAPVYFVSLTEAESWDLAVWTHKLETLQLSLNIENMWSVQDETAERIGQARHKIYQAIGKLVSLRRLTIGQYMTKKAALRLGHGLEHLAGLVRLESLTLSGGSTQLTKSEAQWMVDHWPALVRLQNGHCNISQVPEYVDAETSMLKLNSKTRPWQVAPVEFVTQPQGTKCEICEARGYMFNYNRYVNEIRLREKIEMYEDEFMPSM